MSQPVPGAPISPSQASVFDQEDAPKCIYHYTGPSGLKGIIENNKLWATDVWYMNDTGEATYSAEAIRKFLSSCTPQDEEMKEVHDFAGVLLEKELEGDYRRTYIACLSKDGNQLSQWRAYGCFAIGFNLEVLRTLIPVTSWVNDVVYDESMQQHYLAELFGQAQASLHYYRDDRDGQSKLPPRVSEPMMAAAGFLNNSFVQSAFFKHPAFREEKEIRISIAGPDRLENPSEYPEFRESAMGITPFVEIDLLLPGGQHTSAISEIVIGPQPHKREAERAIRQFLAKQGLSDVEVIDSKVPLRT